MIAVILLWIRCFLFLRWMQVSTVLAHIHTRLWTHALYPAGYHGIVPDPSWTWGIGSYPRPELRSLEVIPDFTKIRVIPDCKWSYSLPELRSLEVIPDFTKIRVIPDCKWSYSLPELWRFSVVSDSTKFRSHSGLQDGVILFKSWMRWYSCR